MKNKYIILLILGLLVMLPVNSGLSEVTDQEVMENGNIHAFEEREIDNISTITEGQVYIENGAIVLDGFKNKVIDQRFLTNIGLDAIETNDSVSNVVVTGKTYNNPLVISNSNNITIQGSTFANINDNYAVSIIGSDNITLFNNDFLNITSDENNIHTTASTDLQVIKTVTSTNISILNNVFQDINVSEGLTMTILSMNGATDSIVSGNIVENSAVTEVGIDFKGFEFISSNNLTVNGNYMYYISAIHMEFISYSNLNEVRHWYNYLFDSVFYNGTGISFTNVNDIESLQYNQIYSNTIQEGNGFVGFKYDTVTDVFDNFTLFTTTIIDTGDLTPIEIINSSNITLQYVIIENLTSNDDRIFGMKIDNSFEITIPYADINFLESTATGIDLDNSQSIYGLYIIDSYNVTVTNSDFTNYESNSQVYGLYMKNSNITSLLNDFNYYTGSIVHGNTIINGIDGTIMVSNYFSSWDASQIYGIEVIDTIANIEIETAVFSSISFTTFGNGIKVENSAHIYLSSNQFWSVYSYAPFFETALASIVDSFNITLRNTIYYGVYSYYSQMSTIFTNNVTDSLLLYNYLYFNYAYETAYIGLYLTNSLNLNVSFNYLYVIVSFATQTSIGIDAVSDKIGYGIVLENTDSSNISNTTVTNVAEWYQADAASTGVILSGNTIGGVEDLITTFTKPNDLIYDADVDAGALLVWAATTVSPSDAANYTITFNGQIVKQGNWTSGASITYQISGLEFGSYVLILELFQSNGFKSTDVVLITATELTSPAFISAPDDFSTVENGEATLDWDVFEINPSSYSIYRGDIEIDYGFYESNTTISFPLKDTTLGTYNFTLTLRDEAGNEASDTVEVTIVEASPITIFAASLEITYELSSVNNTLNFTVFGTIGGDYVVSVNDQTIGTGSWESGIQVAYNISGLAIGQYFYNFFIIDEIGNIEEFDVLVNVIPDQINDSGDDDGGVLDQIGNFVQDVQDVDINSETIIPLAAAAFGGGIIFFPGMKFIRSRVGTAAPTTSKKTKGKKK